MKRKTNLFYKSASQDSNFLTFSNYTEALTANLMSTDNKIYPSRFLCLNIPKLYDKEYAKQEYTNWKNNILSSKNVKYVLQTNVPKAYIDNSILNPTDLYVSGDGLTWRAGSVLTQEQVDLAMSWSRPVVEVKKYKNDANDTYLSSDKNSGTDSTCRVTIKKTYLDYKEDPDFDNPTDVYLWNKQQLINLLTSYYENKLVTLRDSCASEGSNSENVLKPLNYLIETLQMFDSNISIECIGDVTEQDWNGTFADTICIVSTSKYKSGKIIEDVDNNIEMREAYPGNSETYLHGWYVTSHEYVPELDFDADGVNSVAVYENDNNKLYTNLLREKSDEYINKFKRTHCISTTNSDDYNSYIGMIPESDQDTPNYLSTLDAIVKAAEIKENYVGPHYVEDLVPMYDNVSDGTMYYTTSSSISKIDYVNHEGTGNSALEFNILIPLFDVVDMNYLGNSTKVEESTYMDLSSTSTACIMNVPIGMWFSGQSPVSIRSDKSTGFCPTWSLSLSSQFKPFPKSTYMPDEISEDAKKEAFVTFAQILNRQNEMMDKFSDLTKIISKLSDRVETLESSIGSVLTSYNVDNFKIDLLDFKNQVTYQVTYLESEIQNIIPHWEQRD